MANIIAEMQKQKPQIMAEGIPTEQAKVMLQEVVAKWRASKKGRTAKLEGLILTLSWSDGKLAQLFEIDPCPAPKGEKKNQRGSK